MIAEAGGLRDADSALGRYGNLRFDDVFDPVARAGGNIAGQGVAGKGGHGDIVSAPDAGFEHAPAPDGNPLGPAICLNVARAGVAADAAEFDVDDAAGAELDGGLRIAKVGNGFIEAQHGFDLLLQLGVRVNVVPPQRLFHHEQVVVIEAAQMFN